MFEYNNLIYFVAVNKKILKYKIHIIENKYIIVEYIDIFLKLFKFSIK